MLLQPQRRKFRKQHTPYVWWQASNGFSVSFGNFGLKATTNGFLTNREIEAARKVITRYTKKIWKIWIRVFPDVPITKHGLEMPMGKGKWEVDKYVVRVRKWSMIFEVSGLSDENSVKSLLSASRKLSVWSRISHRWEIR